MTVPAPLVRKSTIKQAKASFKTRNNCPISDKEKRQLERGLQLDRRAAWSREKEKKKTEAQKERAEKERLQKRAVVLGTQRVQGRWGFKSSQRHLGAFFGGTGGRNVGSEIGQGKSEGEGESEKRQDSGMEEEADDGFGADELDDDSLLEAFEAPETVTKAPDSAMSPPMVIKNSPSMPPPLQLPCVRRSPAPVPRPAPTIVDEDFSWFEDGMESSTQIARDLDTSDPPIAGKEEVAASTSFGSGDFDLTPEEMDLLDPPQPAKPSKEDQDRMMMPPPPPMLARRVPESKLSQPPRTRTPEPSVWTLPKQTDPGFTMSQLESFVDDDLQLTQIAPG